MTMNVPGCRTPKLTCCRKRERRRRLGRPRARSLTRLFPRPPTEPCGTVSVLHGSPVGTLRRFRTTGIPPPSPAIVLHLWPLPKPGCRHPDSATKPDMNVAVHPAPQQRGACHAYLGNQSLWLFSYRDNVDVTVVDCLSHRSLLAFWAGCDRLRFCPHP